MSICGVRRVLNNESAIITKVRIRSLCFLSVDGMSHAHQIVTVTPCFECKLARAKKAHTGQSVNWLLITCSIPFPQLSLEVKELFFSVFFPACILFFFFLLALCHLHVLHPLPFPLGQRKIWDTDSKPKPFAFGATPQQEFDRKSGDEASTLHAFLWQMA